MKHMLDFSEPVSGSPCVAFGYFDGMHIGHRAVLNQLFVHEKETKVLISFSEENKPILSTEDEKAFILRNKPLDLMVSSEGAEMEAMGAEDFARKILRDRLHASTVILGENASFGAEQAGPDRFRELGSQYGFTVEVVPTVSLDGVPVTTQRIFDAVADSKFDQMKDLLGGPYVMQGIVMHGKAEGRQVGMPTANLGVPANKQFPPHGVYGSLVRIDDEYFRGMTNIGLRPSADNIPIPTIETNILDFNRNIYDRIITLEVHAYIRGVMKFKGGLPEVRRQVDKDIVNIRSYMDKVIAEMEK